jgi:hypothetical protein
MDSQQRLTRLERNRLRRRLIPTPVVCVSCGEVRAEAARRPHLLEPLSAALHRQRNG